MNQLRWAIPILGALAGGGDWALTLRAMTFRPIARQDTSHDTARRPLHADERRLLRTGSARWPKALSRVRP
jgi:hypothetical protein